MPKKESYLTTGISEPAKVEDFLLELKHPLKPVVTYLRNEILSADQQIGEGVYWNAPTFFYTGNLPAFDPKSYKRYLVGFVFNKQDCLRLVFLHGALAKDPNRLLDGNYADGRRLMTINSLADAERKALAIREIILDLLQQMPRP